MHVTLNGPSNPLSSYSMEPGVAAAAYGAETAVEGAVGASMAIARPTMPLRASWKRIPTDKFLPRSSHSVSLVKGRIYIFGGEERAREPVSNDMHIFSLPQSEFDETDYKVVTAVSSQGSTAPVPAPRVGHTATTVDDRIYLFGGRGGKAMAPLEEGGRVWVFDTKLNQWNALDPAKGSPFPQARSYHVSTSTLHPLAGRRDRTEDPLGDADSGFDDHGTVFVHGGCPTSGRTADVWGFDIASRQWSQYADAPGPARGGPCLTFAQNRLYRYGGFDGKNELAGPLQYLHFTASTFDDKGGKGELAVTPRTGKWESLESSEDTSEPGARSVAGLHPVTTGQGRHYLLLFLGERDPSQSGHDSAGNFWSDVWSLQLNSEGMTAASFKDATRWLVGAKTGQNSWAKVDVLENSMTNGNQAHPGSRGWFGSTQGQDIDPASIILWGGVQEDNSRAGDGWILTLLT